ncbi:hypothetical protein [Aquimarina spongiae]|uniref:Cytochrome c domain-containing protein n=1 Tax=Aquimarina spongiae TaxID=570521 RepID=A0A1M6AZA2_9FLAO|nr:hypothetical protein [Aquimarina spongiae]SHI41757.1 hypothetical protein SAMN04488508_101550 [Aquimarina spongiae]
MFQYTKIVVFFSASFFLVIKGCIRDTHVSKVDPVLVTIPSETITTTVNEDSFKTHSETTRKVLITFCGSCHQSSLETHKPAAIAIFDLDKGKYWHATLIHDHIEGIENRIENKSPITREQLHAIEVFLELKASQLKP